jgi:NAD(P)-dependent dehydrogenase (short-subunit alcohol dehydrogenase family)
MQRRFMGRAALVTGAARGIGRAIADALAAEGARLALFDLHGSCVTTAASELQERGVDALAIEGDVSEPVDARRAVQDAVSRFGRLDLLVNNAGIAPMRSFLETDIELYDRVMAVNARGSFLMALEGARAMASAGGGCIVQIASTCAFTAGASRNLCAYNMSKAAVRQMVASLASELADHGIRVNAVAPGTIDTDMTRACLDDDTSAAVMRRIPLKSFGQPADIAEACLFLGSDDARYITGQTIVVDGGRTIGGH